MPKPKQQGGATNYENPSSTATLAFCVHALARFSPGAVRQFLKTCGDAAEGYLKRDEVQQISKIS